MRKVVLLSLMILVFSSALTRAQIASDGAATDSTPKIAHPLPFKVGETLSYEVSFSKYIFGGDVADLKLSVSRAAQPSLLELKADLVSKGFFPKLFGVKVKNRFTAIVSSNDLGLLSSTKQIEEGKSRRRFDRAAARSSAGVARRLSPLGRSGAATRRTCRRRSSPPSRGPRSPCRRTPPCTRAPLVWS